MKRVFFLIGLLITINLYADNIEAGKNIFKSRCASCHKMDSKFVGPALRDIDKRRSIEWIIKFVQSSQAVIKSGDADAVKVFNENDQANMPDQPDLKEDDIKNIIAYINDESSKAPQQATQGIARPQEEKGGNRPIAANNYWLFIGIGIFIVFIMYILNMVIKAVDVSHQYQAKKLANHKRCPGCKGDHRCALQGTSN